MSPIRHLIWYHDLATSRGARGLVGERVVRLCRAHVYKRPLESYTGLYRRAAPVLELCFIIFPSSPLQGWGYSPLLPPTLKWRQHHRAWCEKREGRQSGDPLHAHINTLSYSLLCQFNSMNSLFVFIVTDPCSRPVGPAREREPRV